MLLKKFAILLYACLTVQFAASQSTIEADINNIKNDRGVCQVCVYGNAAAFDGKGAPNRCLQVPIINRRAVARFENMEAGMYAVLVFHDANANKKLDQNFLGIPKEGYGASLNKLPFANAPGFEDNKFSLPAHSTVTLRIRLRNL